MIRLLKHHLCTLIITLLLVLGLSLISSANNWTFSPGIRFQTGQYDYSTGSWDFSVSVPETIYVVKAISPDDWTISGQYGSHETNNASMDPGFLAMMRKYTDKYDGNPYGRSTELAGSLGYQLHFGETIVEPSIGYSRNEFSAGAEKTVYDESGDYDQLVKHTFGLRAEGINLGISFSAPISPSLDLDLDGKFSPNLVISEVRYIYSGQTPVVPGEKETEDIRYPFDQESFGYSLSARLKYRLTEKATISTCYQWEKATSQFHLLYSNPGHGFCMADQWEYSINRISIKLDYTF